MTSRMWMVTINVNDADHQWNTAMVNQNDADFRYLTGQLEIAPTTGQNHYQLFLQLKNPQRMTKVKTILNCNWAHCEKKLAASTVQNCIDYCTKAESRAPGAERIEIGECALTQGARNDITEAVQAIKRGAGMAELIDDHPEIVLKYARGLSVVMQTVSAASSMVIRADLQVHVLWGAPGTGKTRAVYDQHGLENVFTLHQMPTLWFDGYTGQKILLLDDFYGWIQWGTLLKMLDIYPFQGPVKGGFTHARWTHVYITSNRPWYNWYKKTDQGALQRRIHVVRKYLEDGVVEEETVETRDNAYTGQYADGFNPA